MMIKIPPYLLKGDTIGLVCPAGYMDLEKAQSCIHAFQDWGYNTRIGASVGGNSENYFSGTDKERLNDFQKMLDDGKHPDFWSYLYYSVVTFTTLGFGDIVPITNIARIAVGTEVILGYVMLGGLISIFANKLARRS